MKRFKPHSKSIAYLANGAAFPSDGAIINPAMPFYARQIADGDLISDEPDASDPDGSQADENTVADHGKKENAARGETKTKRKG